MMKTRLWVPTLWAMVIVTLFWIGWRFIVGYVPAMSALVYGDRVVQLPWVISRWLDIPVAGIFALAVAGLIFYSATPAEDAWGLTRASLLIGIAAGLVVGLLVVLSLGWVVGPVLGLATSGVVWLIAVLPVYILLRLIRMGVTPQPQQQPPHP